jgi:tetratricopeptide (TPR) repeat protein
VEGAGLEGAPISELIGVREKPEAARGVPGLRARLIGRETSLQAMIELSRYLNQNLGGLIWVEGEPGIGKSRLLQEFASSLLTTDGLLWSGRCSPQRSGQAFSLFADLFVQAFDLQPHDTPDQLRASIQQAIQGWPRDAQLMQPYVETLLGLQPGGLEGKRMASLEPEQLRQQIFVALRRLFKSLSQEQPVVLLLDDLHWIDPMSAELLQFLVPMVASAPILFVCAQRRQGADSPNDRLVRAHGLIPSQTVRLTLARLSNSESETLLGELLPHVKLPDRLRNTVLERSEGNPYFIEEYVRVLIEQRYLQYHQGRWTFDPAQGLGDIPMPSSLETLIRSRIDALPSDLKQLVQCAAVIGPSFETGLLEAIADVPNVKGALTRLESRLLVQRGRETGQWEFNHSMIETVVYSTLLKARRKTIHLKIAETLEARWAGTEAEHAEALAYHYSRAGEDNKALIYLVLAGERAAARYAIEEARTYLEQAKQLMSQNSELDQSLNWHIDAGLGDVYRAMGQYAQSRAVLEEGLAVPETRLRAGLHRRLGETAQKHGDLERAYEHFSQALTILGELDDPQAQAEVARVLNGLGWIHYVRGHFDQARAACEASLTYARSADALNELAAAENLLGGIYLHQSEWKSALHHTTRAMILREQMGYTWGVASTLANLGVLAVAAGHWGKARSFFERSLALRQEMGDAEGIALAHNNLGSLARDQGDLDLAEYHFKESLAVSQPSNIAFHVANSGLGLAHVFLLKGETEAAQQVLTASLDQARAIGAEDMLAEVHRIQAEILMAKSAWHDAESAAKQSAVLAAKTGNRSLEATAWRVLSEIALQREDLEAAREALADARHALADASDELEAGRVAAQAGRIHMGEGQLVEAETELRVAQEIFMRLGAALDLKRVEQSLRTRSIV